jgi:pyruvate,water dikinase
VIWPVDNEPDRRFPIYTRGNVGEVFPDVVTPLTWSALGDAAELGWRDAFARFGVLRLDDFGNAPMGILGVFAGYCYLNASYIRVFAVRTPGLTVEDLDSIFFGESEAPGYVSRPGDKNLAASLNVGRTLLRTLTAKALPALDDDKVRVNQWLGSLPEPASASDEQLIGIFPTFNALFRRLFDTHIHTSFQATVGPGLLGQICEGKLDDPTLPNKLLAGIGSVESAGPSFAMWQLSRLTGEEFDRRFAEFLVEYGSRGPNEWESSSPTWGTKPELALAAIDCMRTAPADHDPVAQQARLERERVEATAAARTRLKGPSRWQFDRALRSAQLFSQGRERSKTTVIKAVHGLRLAALELAERARRRGGPDDVADMWLVTLGELPDYVADPKQFADTLDERRALRDRLAGLVPPFVFESAQAHPDTWASRSAQLGAVQPGTCLTGIAGCPGVARGRARVVLDPLDARGLEPGDVLVAPITDPSWTPLFVPAEAVVVDVGAQLSHAVIVSRELGIPAVVSVTDATRTIPDGALLEVDGDRGTVTVVELP